MKQLFFVANWKSYKTTQEASEWFDRFKIQDVGFKNKEVIICPSFTVIPSLKSLIINHKSPIHLGAQDISPFDEGAYTGEVNGKQLKELVDYVLVGHSERRKDFAETDAMLKNKLEQVYHYGLTPILCISEISQLDAVVEVVDTKAIIVAYEPLFAIGSGLPDSSESAEKMAEGIVGKLPQSTVLYGGSVTGANVSSYLEQKTIQGVLVGSASLSPEEFSTIIKHA